MTEPELADMLSHGFRLSAAEMATKIEVKSNHLVFSNSHKLNLLA